MSPKKNASSSSAQQKNKGKEVVPESSIPHFGPVVEKEVVVDPNAFFKVERIVTLLVIHELPPSQEEALPAIEGKDEVEDEVPLVRKRRVLEVIREPDLERVVSGAAAGPSGQGEEMEQTEAPKLRTTFLAGKTDSVPIVKRPRFTKKAPPAVGNVPKSSTKGKGTSSTSPVSSVTERRIPPPPPPPRFAPPQDQVIQDDTPVPPAQLRPSEYQ
ncbi:uncharacterized protein LOC133779332 [Humulus lupulus]|uniref:uncharacterized protein LOC133779332 n=1 Tax=Humulus lupulus TaxID=3486 RepID=UPI002B40A3C6|nr:uncharacterized protein LOC133779332 [Humulus lupulus]